MMAVSKNLLCGGRAGFLDSFAPGRGAFERDDHFRPGVPFARSLASLFKLVVHGQTQPVSFAKFRDRVSDARHVVGFRHVLSLFNHMARYAVVAGSAMFKKNIVLYGVVASSIHHF